MGKYYRMKKARIYWFSEEEGGRAKNLLEQNIIQLLNYMMEAHGV